MQINRDDGSTCISHVGITLYTNLQRKYKDVHVCDKVSMILHPDCCCTRRVITLIANTWDRYRNVHVFDKNQHDPVPRLLLLRGCQNRKGDVAAHIRLVNIMGSVCLAGNGRLCKEDEIDASTIVVDSCT